MRQIGASLNDLERFRELLLQGSMTLAPEDRLVVEGDFYSWDGTKFVLVPEVQGDEKAGAALSPQEIRDARLTLEALRPLVAPAADNKGPIFRPGDAIRSAFERADLVANERDAASFLQKATHGPRYSEIQSLVALGSKRAWTLNQFNLAMSRSFCARGFVDYGATSPNVFDQNQACNQAIFTSWVDEPPLRMKLVHVLQKLFVISQPGGAFADFGRIYAWLSWLDMLDFNVFGNWRNLIEDVTYSPHMSIMLTYYANRKASGTSQPDENYAREIMQLFSIGLYELNPDGSYKLDVEGQPIPTYTNDDIRELARCFTGLTRWTFNGTTQRYNQASTAAETQFTSAIATSDYDDLFSNPRRRLVHYLPAYDDGAKYALGGRINIPRGTGPEDCLKMVHDALFNHPNTPVFFAIRMIQSLVTSNPSPAYVSRVVRAFEDNGAGVRGDLKAVWLAILTDPEANTDGRYASTFGRIRDGHDLYLNVVRSLDSRNSQSRVNPARDDLDNAMSNYISRYGRTAFRTAPSIFGAYDPLHQPTELQESGLYAPEAQMWFDFQIIACANDLNNFCNSNEPRDTRSTGVSTSDRTMLPLTGTIDELIERLNVLLCGGRMSSGLRTSLQTVLASVTAWQTGGSLTTAQQNDRSTVALQMVLNTPDFWVQL